MATFIYQAFLCPEEEGGYSAYIPDLKGCFSEGDTLIETVEMIADAGKTYISALVKEGEKVPVSTVREIPEGNREAWVSFEADPSYVIAGDVISAAQAARELGLSAGRITHMLNAGLLDGYREGRRTWITKESVKARVKEPRNAGRPKRLATA